MTPITLQIGADRYTGWKRIEVSLGMEQLAGSFSLVCADRWAIAGQQTPILEGSRCTVQVGDTTIITGYVDGVDVSYSATQHELTITGRDATGDLVDSAAVVDGQGWKGRTLAQIAESLCKPFGIPVSVDTNIGNAYSASIFKKRDRGMQGLTPRFESPFRCQAVNPGETVHEVLHRAARLRGCLLMSDGLGGLHITTTGATRATRSLVRGRDILAGRVHRSHAERFHTYRVLGQQNEIWSDGTAPQAQQQILATATDPEIRAARVTVIDPIDELDTATARRLAQWAVANRKAQGLRADVTVRGWMDGATPWAPNRIVHAVDSWLGLNGSYLIACVQFGIDSAGGEQTLLTLTPPEAYVPQPDRETQPKYGVQQ